MGDNKAYHWRDWDDGWTDELPIQPQYPLPWNVERAALGFLSEAGYRQTASLADTSRHIWPGLSWKGLTSATAYTLLSFFTGHLAASTGFLWVQPNGDSYRVKVRNPKIVREQRGGDLYAVTVDFIEVMRAGNYGT